MKMGGEGGMGRKRAGRMRECTVAGGVVLIIKTIAINVT